MIRDLVIELVSPLILGGAERNQCDDPPTLRPPSLRGQLRFWSRALGTKALEERLFGTTETGQRVRVLGAQPLAAPREAFLFPHKDRERDKSVTPMIPPGELVLVRFAVPRPDLLEPLQAVVWTWLHLGAVGRRSRRGYGAFVWEPHPGHLLDGFLAAGFDRRRDLAGPAELAAYLERGLGRVFEVAGEVAGVAPEATRTSRGTGDDFTLRSLDQVFVGKHLRVADKYGGRFRWHLDRPTSSVGPTDAATSLEWLLHGLSPDARGDSREREQLGLGRPRLPSPMIWRLHPCSTGGHLPAMVWSPVGYPTGAYPQLHEAAAEKLCRYLSEDLGFCDSLAGTALIA